MDRHTMSQQKHPSLGRGHQKTSINVRTIDEWKKKGLISGTEFTYTKCIVKRLLDIKAAAVSKQHEAEATDAIHRSTVSYSARKKSRSDSLVSNYDWGAEGKDKAVDDDEMVDKSGTSTCCCCCQPRKKLSFGTWLTQMFYGYGPDFPAPHRILWKNHRNIDTTNFIYKTLIWIGYASASLLITYGLVSFVTLVTTVTLIYSAGSCVTSAATTTNAVTSPMEKILSIVLVTISQLIGGGTAPGTVRADGALCGITSICISILNVGLRSLFFAAGLTSLMEAEPEMIFSPKICISMRDGIPTLLIRFALAGSDCAVVDQIWGNYTNFFKSTEGDSMSKSTYVSFKCFPTCSSPVVASYQITSDSPLHELVEIMPDGTCQPNMKRWENLSVMTLHLVVYDFVSERMIRRTRVYQFSDVLFGHKFHDVMTTGIMSSVLNFIPPQISMKFMNMTNLQKIEKMVGDSSGEEEGEEEGEGKEKGKGRGKGGKKEEEEEEEMQKELQDGGRISLEELDLLTFAEQDNLSTDELIYLKSIFHRCLQAEEDSGVEKEEFIKYLRDQFPKEQLSPQKAEEEYRQNHVSHLKKCRLQRSMYLCWSCRCFEKREKMSISDVMTEAFMGQHPDYMMTIKNRNSGLRFDLLYKITRCIHVGDIRTVLFTFVMIAASIAAIVGLGYQNGQCYSILRVDNYTMDNYTIAATKFSPADSDFITMFTSTAIQLATGTPSNPLRHDLPYCAVLTLIVSFSNVILRVLVFVVGLHALEKAKPNIVFSSKMVLMMRNNVPTLQFRCAAPSSPALQILDLKVTFSSIRTTKEGETHANINTLHCHTPPFITGPVFISHSLNIDSPLKQSWIKNGHLPAKHLILVKLGLFDKIKSQYIEAIRVYHMHRDVVPFHTFTDTIEIGLFAAHASDKDLVVNGAEFQKTQPQVVGKQELIAVNTINSERDYSYGMTAKREAVEEVVELVEELVEVVGKKNAVGLQVGETEETASSSTCSVKIELARIDVKK
jgi:hypothetical protein